MKIDIITLFPAMFNGVFGESILARAQKNKIIKIRILNLRDFAKDRYRTVDDEPFGGGCGMVLKPEPLHSAINYAKNGTKKSKVIYLSPQGRVFNQSIAKKLSKEKHIILLCGHYEGIDERVMKFVDEEISIGDYILTGGEIAAMAVIDCIARLIPKVVKESNSIKEESFSNSLLDYPCYTRPREFKGMKVPEILLSGNHKKIRDWRLQQSLKNTKIKRPDLYKIYGFAAKLKVKN
ncbi:MAG: tRNA (guanosine(37)-N1)-methyltransferase TrmD [Elusimicrobiota bacterium]